MVRLTTVIFLLKLIQSTSMRPGFLRLEIIMSKLQDWISLYKDVVLFFFSFFSKTSASSQRERARKKNSFSIFFLPHNYPFALAVNNPPRLIFYHSRSKDFEEK